MSLFSLAKKNIKGNFSNYFVYFISLVFSMVIYYTFTSLQYSQEIQDSIQLSDTMKFMFMASSVVLILFVAIFILYSNSFFTRKRKKEVGLYSMLGLRKKTIAKMLLYENLIMGITALIVGIVLGTLLSQLFSMILIKLMGTSVEINFGISFMAILQTAIVFMVINLFTSFQGYRLIYRFKLIDLFHAEKQGETIPNASIISTVVGIILLIISYWLILRPFPEELNMAYFLKNYGVALILLVVGTYLFFRSVTVYILKLLQRNKRHYYRGTNLIQTSQLLYRIRGNSRTFTMIALLSAATISFLCTTYSGYYSNEVNSRKDVPFSYTHLSQNEEFDQKIETIIQNDQEHPILAELEIPVIETNGDFSFEMDYDRNPTKFIAESTFNQASEALNYGVEVTLEDNQATVIKPRLTKYTSEDFVDEHVTIDDNADLTFTGMVEGSVLPFDFPDFFVVISDDMFQSLANEFSPLVYKAYEVEDELTTEATAVQVNELIKGDFQVHSSFYSEYKIGKEGNALNLFIFGFLGLVFLAATGSIIYFKQLTEANESKDNYDILNKVGVSKKDIRRSVSKQMRFVFGIPLIVGLIHSIIMLNFITNFISGLIGANLFTPIVTAMAAFIVIYLGYYILTVKTYNNIVMK
ncbi:ABC transporter permease [Gracilibacillus sp. D59]|uniref:ABC transporter permease n=1 Tax=Gracilibacillus sp. D59 TaxID=3457434 RepID=UPI003FCD5FC4